jgi:hypothetical protein
MSDEITLAAASTVQNGTGATDRGVMHYVDKFKSLRRDSSSAVLDLAETLIDAEDALSKEDFEYFCAKVGVAASMSYHKKLRTIGKRASHLKPQLELLPPCWTTIYKLAQMPAEKFDDFVAAGALSPKTKAKDISKFLGGSANGEGVSEPSRGLDAGQRVVISFGKLDVEAKKRVAAEIFQLAQGLSAFDSGEDDVGASDPFNIAA